jgi:uncharacterized SAM-binding protein YcdF (DUF218 family)
VSLLIIIVCVAAACAAFVLLRRLGPWLVVNDPLERADCILVLGGHVPFRAMEAAALYHQQWAPEIWLTQFPQNREEAILSSMGIDLFLEFVVNRQVLEHENVPADRIWLIDEPSNDTFNELSNTHRRFRQRFPGGTIILVTSRFHARRVKVIWRRLAGGAERACVRTTDISLAPDKWFTDKGDVSQVAHEAFGLLNLWMGNLLKRDRSRQAVLRPEFGEGRAETMTTGAPAYRDDAGRH